MFKPVIVIFTFVTQLMCPMIFGALGVVSEPMLLTNLVLTCLGLMLVMIYVNVNVRTSDFFLAITLNLFAVPCGVWFVTGTVLFASELDMALFVYIAVSVLLGTLLCLFANKFPEASEGGMP